MKEIKIWVDDCRPAPAGYYFRTSIDAVNSMNPIGVQNIRAIIQRDGWKETL